MKRRTVKLIAFFYGIFYILYLYPLLVGLFINIEYSDVMGIVFAPFKDGYFSTLLVSIVFSFPHVVVFMMGLFFQFLDSIFKPKSFMLISFLFYMLAGSHFSLSYFGLAPLIVLVLLISQMPKSNSKNSNKLNQNLNVANEE